VLRGHCFEGQPESMSRRTRPLRSQPRPGALR
jgi:hypothetical protein